MRMAHSARRLLQIGGAAALLLALGGYVAGKTGIFLPVPAASIAPSELRGAWVQARALTSRERIDAMLARAQSGHFNAIFVCVFSEGQALYESALADMSERVTPGFDPLAYLVPEAHRRGIAVHAWFVAGLVGDEARILAEHPDWALVGPDGKTAGWLNFTRPDVRQFVSDLMLETVERYGVDGVHFDYTRYPGPEWGFDPYSVEAFTRENDFELDQLRYADLPAYGTYDGNPLVEPTTAEVLAVFSNGLPAVALNRYGDGEVVLLNWNASERTVAAGGEILRRGIGRLIDPGGAVFVMRSETNARTYGYDDFLRAMAWLDQLGWRPREVAEEGVAKLGVDSVVVLPNVYRITPEAAGQLADFVRRGGGAVFVDGPTPSIEISAIQDLTGMRSRGRHFEQTMLMTTVGQHPLVPDSGRDADLAAYQSWDGRWKAFRKRGINALIREVYLRAKERDAGVAVTVTITSDQEQAAEETLQDWPSWLAGGYVDLLIPRGYVDAVQLLGPAIADWRPALRDNDRITVGLKVFTADGKAAVVKSPRQVLAEIAIAHEAGSTGIMLFDLDRVSDDQLRALASGPFSEHPLMTRP